MAIVEESDSGRQAWGSTVRAIAASSTLAHKQHSLSEATIMWERVATFGNRARILAEHLVFDAFRRWLQNLFFVL